MASRRRKQGDDGTHRYRGVFRSPSETFVAQVMFGGKLMRLGSWPSPEQAAVARDRAVLHLRIDRPLALPKVSQRLGPAAPLDLIGEARLALKSHRAAAQTKRPISRYYGVHWSPAAQCWVATLKIPGEPVHIGCFEDEREAAVARDRYALHALGPATPLNFPNAGLEPTPLERLRSTSRQKRKRERASPGSPSSTRRRKP